MSIANITMVAEERPAWRKLVTPALTRARPVHRWYLYPHSFDSDLVKDVLAQMGIRPGHRVWDPFVGAGTTVLACRDLGIEAFGSDLLPLSIVVSQAKLSSYSHAALSWAAQKFDYRIQPGSVDRFAQIPIVTRSISARIRVRVSSLLDQILRLPSDVRPFFMIALLGILEDLSYTIKSGGWLRLDMTKDIREAAVRELFETRVQAMLEDVPSDPRYCHPDCSERVWLADARTERFETPVDAIVTSPPYPNRHDYTRIFALELALLQVADAEELKQLRYRSLRSHVEARDPDLPMDQYCEPQRLQDCLERVAAINTRDRRVHRMLRGYFQDMYHVLHSVHENLARGGKAAFVLGDVRFAGVIIPVNDLVGEIGAAVGLRPLKLVVARRRGNSAQQMRVYGRQEARESVIFFERAN